MDTKHHEALRLAHIFEHPLPPEWSDMVAATKELRRLHAENEAMRTGCDAARLEIESLQARVQELGQQARECSDRKVVKLDARIKELEAQLDAVGAGGVEPLRKREENLCKRCTPVCQGGEGCFAGMPQATHVRMVAFDVQPERKRECLHQIAEPAPLNKATAEHVLRRILHIVQRYLPPDGTSIDKAMNEIIAVVDPWPVAEGDAGMYPQLPDPFMTSHEEAGCCYPDTFSADQMRAYADATCTAREPLRKRECLHSISEPEAQPVGVAPEWWRKRADEIETDVARGGSIAAMNCYTKMRQLLQAATSPQPAPQVQADAPVVLPEPVAAQSRFADTPSDTWDSCSVEHARSFGGVGYEVRYLYTEQQVRAMLAAAPKPPAHEPLRCSCHTCWPIAADDPASTFMRFCPACGNKRCPKANDHRHACTGSNEPGQPGSAYQLTGGITAAQKGDAPK